MHVVDDGRRGGGRRGQSPGLDDGGSTLLDSRNKLIADPGHVDFFAGRLAVNPTMKNIRILRRRVVSPDCQFADLTDM